MTAFMEKMVYGPRKIAVTGHFGCGKTEFAVSLAFALAALCKKEHLALADLDVENPYFRSREMKNALESAGVAVYSDPYGGRSASELQTIDAAIRAPLEDEGCRVILDAGGDFTGAMILNQYKKYLTPGEYQLLFVVNKNRPGTDTPEKALEHLLAIEDITGLKVTGLISNSHLVRYSTASDVLEGWEFTRRVGELSDATLLCACCMESLLPQLARCGFDVFPVGMYMRSSYLDKQV